MRKQIVVALSIAVAVILGVTLSHFQSSTAVAQNTSTTEVAPTLPQLRATALRIATKAGDKTPTSIEETSGTLGHAATAIDPQDAPPEVTDPRTGAPWASSSVDIITMRGDFEAYGRIPRGQPVPTGTVLTFVVDAQSGFVEIISIGNAAPDLATVGANVTNLEGESK
jgi:hypothetical protein